MSDFDTVYGAVWAWSVARLAVSRPYSVDEYRVALAEILAAHGWAYNQYMRAVMRRDREVGRGRVR